MLREKENERSYKKRYKQTAIVLCISIFKLIKHFHVDINKDKLNLLVDVQTMLLFHHYI